MATGEMGKAKGIYTIRTNGSNTPFLGLHCQEPAVLTGNGLLLKLNVFGL